MPVVYNFDSSQRAALQALVDAGQWFNAYSFVLQMISDQTPGVERPAAGVPMAEWLWVRGAQLVNSNSGPLANFIREYTKEQYEIRTGGTLTDGRVQDASDEVARNFFNDVLGKRSDNPGVFGLRDIGTIGRADAAGAASVIFSSYGRSDTYDGDVTPWAGTVLFVFLGVDEFVTNWVAANEDIYLRCRLRQRQHRRGSDRRHDGHHQTGRSQSIRRYLHPRQQQQSPGHPDQFNGRDGYRPEPVQRNRRHRAGLVRRWFHLGSKPDPGRGVVSWHGIRRKHLRQRKC